MTKSIVCQYIFAKGCMSILFFAFFFSIKNVTDFKNKFIFL